MQINSDVNRRLKEIHKERSNNNYIPVLITFLVSVYFQKEKLTTHNTWIYCTILMLLGAVSRKSCLSKYFEEWVAGKQSIKRLNYFGFVLGGLGLGLHFVDVCVSYGGGSVNVAYTLYLVVAIIAAAANTLTADKGSYIVYVSTLKVCLIGSYIYYFNDAPKWVLPFVLINYLYALKIQGINSKQLKELVTLQLSAEKENLRLLEIINSVPGLVAIINAERIITMTNDSFKEVYPGAVGVKIGELNSTEEMQTYIQGFLNSDRKSSIKEMITLRNGQETWVLVSLSKQIDGGATIISLPINELVEAREQIKSQEAKMAYSSKLASLGEMAAGIAHEINNPLAILSASAALIKKTVNKKPIDENQLISLTDKFSETVGRISRTVKSMRTLSRQGENDPFLKFSPQNLVRQVMDLSEHKFKQNEVELKLPEFSSTIQIEGREVELGQVLLNLVVNALDAVEKQTQKWIKIDFEINNQWLDLKVIDSGPGIPPEIQKKIMEPFFTTKDVNKGTGLGLSISKSIMEKHGGELIYKNDAPNTTFIMRLPFITIT